MNTLVRAWQSRGWLACVLWPVSLLLRLIVALRSWFLKYRRLQSTTEGDAVTVPVIVVGNISVGGTGKSPLTASLVEFFQAQGWRPGIVARGYGGSKIDTPQWVSPQSDPAHVGDEPVMLSSMTGVPVCVCRHRAQALATLAESGNVDIVFSDDGLQHYAMHRDVEIAVIDEHRGLGNGWLLPAGPLREPPSRLKTVDLIAVHRTVVPADATAGAPIGVSLPENVSSGTFCLRQVEVRALSVLSNSTESIPLQSFAQRRVHAVAGIGDPERFFRQLEQADISVIAHPFADHHAWSASDLSFNDELPILMTSKDAVKVRYLIEQTGSVNNADLMFEVSVRAELDVQLTSAVASIEENLRARH